MAGEEIDATLGVKLGFSTLASAGLGNLVSDVAGIGFADQLEVSNSLRWLLTDSAARYTQGLHRISTANVLLLMSGLQSFGLQIHKKQLND